MLGEPEAVMILVGVVARVKMSEGQAGLLV